MDGLRFWNMVEARYFLKCLDKRIKTPLVAEEVWEETKQATAATYARSQSLPYLKRCIEQFEQTNKVKYLSDFKEFVYESSVERLLRHYWCRGSSINHSQSQGREFDDEHMLITDSYEKDDYLMRRYYVGIT